MVRLMLPGLSDPAQAARYPYADYRSWLIGRFPGGQQAFTVKWPGRYRVRIQLSGLPSLKAEILAFSPEAAPVLDFLHDFEHFQSNRA